MAHTRMLDELCHRGLIHTKSAPVGDLAEHACVLGFGGVLVKNSKQSQHSDPVALQARTGMTTFPQPRLAAGTPHTTGSNWIGVLDRRQKPVRSPAIHGRSIRNPGLVMCAAYSPGSVEHVLLRTPGTKCDGQITCDLFRMARPAERKIDRLTSVLDLHGSTASKLLMAFVSSITAAHATSGSRFRRSRGDRAEPSSAWGRSGCGASHQLTNAAAI
jgi:hypothetical protein